MTVNEDDGWFEDALDEVTESRRAKAIAGAAKRVESARRAAAFSSVRSPREVAEAATTFEAVKRGVAPALGTGVRVGVGGGPVYTHTAASNTTTFTMPQHVTPNQGLDAIVEAVRDAGDPDEVLRVGGEWITRITNAITEAIREADDD